MTYSQIKEVIRDICSPCTIYDIKKANAKIKKVLDSYLIRIKKVEDELTTIVWYSFVCKDSDDIEVVGYDFWNHNLAY